MESAICSRGLLKELSPGSSIEQFYVLFLLFQFGVRCPQSKETAGSCPPFRPHLSFSFPMVQTISEKLQLSDAGRMQPFSAFPVRGWKRSRCRGGGASCFESCFELGAGGKVQSSPFGKGRLGSAPAPHALSIFSFIQRQTELLPLPLLVCDTFLRQLFHSAEGLAAMTPGVLGQRTRRLNVFLPWEVKPGIGGVSFPFFFFSLCPPMWLPHFFIFIFHWG